MSKPPKPPPVVLHIQPSYRHDDPEGNRRLRAVLKWMLRSYGFRVTRMDCPQEKPQGTQTPPSASPH